MGAHHGLNAITQCHRTYGAVVQRVNIREILPFRSRILRVFPRQPFGQICPGVFSNQFMLACDELLLLLFNLRFNPRAECAGILDGFTQVLNGSVAVEFLAAVCKPSRVFGGVICCSIGAQSIGVEFDKQIGFVWIQDDVRDVCLAVQTQLIKPSAHFEISKIKCLVVQTCGCDFERVFALSFIQGDVASSREVDGSMQVHGSCLVPFVLIVCAIHV